MKKRPQLCDHYWAIAAILLLGCSTARQQPAQGQIRADRIQAPAKPGTSITHTQMCSCTACDPASCCEGDVSDPETQSCGEGYDFAAGQSCGLSVRSCSSRCFTHVWRISATRACEGTAPSVCCG